MNPQFITIQTQATGRIIRQSINALLRANTITSGYKIPHTKYFSLDENKKTITTNLSLLILQKGKKRDVAGPKILDQILKERTEFEGKLG